jgi:GNAT superfamily N-acetyltransferase
MSIDVREVTESDAPQWRGLYAGYRDFYHLPEDADAVETTWRWVSQREHGMIGLVAVAEADGSLLGLANLRRFARPSFAATGLYLDDLFTAPSARRRGVAGSLLRAARERAAAEGANVVRWITAADNTTARSLYDQVATATSWVTYDMKPDLE